MIVDTGYDDSDNIEDTKDESDPRNKVYLKDSNDVFLKCTSNTKDSKSHPDDESDFKNEVYLEDSDGCTKGSEFHQDIESGINSTSNFTNTADNSNHQNYNLKVNIYKENLKKRKNRDAILNK